MAFTRKNRPSLEEIADKKIDETGLEKKESEPIQKPEQPTSKLTLHSIRLPENYSAILIKHFKDRGADLSTGIRMILIEYMKKSGLIQ